MKGCPEWAGWWCPEVRDRKILKSEEAVWMPRVDILLDGYIVRAEITLAATLLIMEETKGQLSTLFW